MLINMWKKDINTFNAGNYGLLRIIFELNLQMNYSNNNNNNNTSESESKENGYDPEVEPEEEEENTEKHEKHENKSKNKMLLCFVIRDYDGIPGETSCEKVIMKNIERIWSGLRKPENMKQDIIISSIFDIKFVFLSHYILQKEKFLQGIKEIKPWFISPDSQDVSEDSLSVMKDEYRKNSVPLDGFETYCSNIWKSIKENQDLDIPTQKVMLARFRCTEISQEILTKNFNPIIQKWKNKILQKLQVMKTLGNDMQKIIRDISNLFKKRTFLYVTSISDIKLQELERQMLDECKGVFVSQMQLVRRRAQEGLEKFMEGVVNQSKGHLVLGYGTCVRRVRDKFRLFFKDWVDKSKIPLHSKGMKGSFNSIKLKEWDRELNEVTILLEEGFERKFMEILKHQMLLFTEKMKSELRGELSIHVKKIARNPPISVQGEEGGLWSAIKGVIKDILSTKYEEMYKALNEFKYDDCETDKKRIKKLLEDEHLKIMNILKKHSIEVSKTGIKGHIPYLINTMVNIFERSFPPKRSKDINEVYETARDKSLLLLNDFYLCRLDFNSDNSNSNTSNTSDIFNLTIPSTQEERHERRNIEYPEEYPEDDLLMSKDLCNGIFKDFTREIVEKRLNHIHEIERLSRTSVPWWIFIVIIVLGWNEMMMVLKNPLYLLLGLAIFILFGWHRVKGWIERYMRDGDNYLLRSFMIQVAVRLPNGIINVEGVSLDEDDSTDGNDVTPSRATGDKEKKD